MTAELGTGIGALALLVGFPLLLLGIVGVLGWLEEWMLHPYERGVVIQRLLEDAQGADEVEAAVARLTAQVADPAAQRARRRRAARSGQDPGEHTVVLRSRASEPAR